MGPTPFPPCRHGGEAGLDRVRPCRSPKLVGSKRVTARECLGCYCRDDPGPGGVDPPPPRRVVIRTPLYGWGGYPQHAMALGRGLEARGIGVAYWPMWVDESLMPLPAYLRDRIVPDPPDPWVLQLAAPSVPFPEGKAVVAFSMYESTRPPADWMANLNRARAVLTPSRWCADVFSARGCDRPLFVVPHGVDAREFAPPVRPPGGPFTFGVNARLAHGLERKNVLGVIRAFQAAFPDDPDVRLSVKLFPDCPPLRIADPRIDVLRETFTTDRLADWFRSLHCLVNGACAGGFELVPLQAMSCGVPVISTDYSGMGEYVDRSVAFLLDYDLVPAAGTYTGQGVWGRPRESSLIARMREVRSDPSVARAVGEAGLARARAMSWDATTARLVAALEDVGLLDRGAPPPAHRPPTPPAPIVDAPDESTPIAVAFVAYNNLEYTCRTLASLEANPEAERWLFYFYVDGDPAADPAVAAVLSRIEASSIRRKVVRVSGSRLGPNRNLLRAWRETFADGSPWVLLFEHDMVVAPSYLRLIRNLAAWARRRPERIGYVQAYSPCRLAREEKAARLGEVGRSFHHVWGVGLRRAAWEEIRPILDEYERTYLMDGPMGHLPHGDRIWDFYRGLRAGSRERPDEAFGGEPPHWAVSYDGVFHLALNCRGWVNYATIVNRGLPIGETGAHFNPEEFRAFGFDRMTLDQFPEDASLTEFVPV